MMLCYRRLVDDDQTAQLRIFVSRGPLCHPERRLPRSTSLRAGSVEGSTRSDLLTPPSKALFCHSPRASRRIPALFRPSFTLRSNPATTVSSTRLPQPYAHGR